MSEKQELNKVLVRRIYDDLWNNASLDAAAEIFQHPEGVRKFIKEFLAAFPDLHHTVQEMIAEGDHVVALFSADGTHTGQWKQYLPTGRSIHYTGVTVARIEGGLIIQHRTWWDTHELIEQISR